MARQLRLHAPGGFYHVTLRGNHRQPVFFRDADRELLESIVEEVNAVVGTRVHAYCWMTNHIHLLMQVSDVPLGRAVLRIASRYARTVQTRMATSGHLFERRYHCVLVDADNYLLTLIRYIHLNPVRAGLVNDPGEYCWSSHQAYLGRVERKWVTTRLALETLSTSPTIAIEKYRAFMGVAQSDRWGTGELTTNRADRQILGDDEFASRVASARWQPRSMQTLATLIAECESRFSVSSELLASPSKSHVLAVARAWLAHEAVAGRVATISDTARQLKRTEGSIRQLMSRYPRENRPK
jgi:REP element-mobilizing transposase RayT